MPTPISSSGSADVADQQCVDELTGPPPASAEETPSSSPPGSTAEAWRGDAAQQPAQRDEGEAGPPLSAAELALSQGRARPGSGATEAELRQAVSSDLKGLRREEAEKVLKALGILRRGTPAERLGALASLMKLFPKASEKSLSQLLGKAGVKDKALQKLLSGAAGYKALSLAFDDKAKPAEWAKASADLAKLLVDSGSALAPALTGELKALHGPIAVVACCATLLSDKATPKEKATAGAKLLAEFPTLTGDVEKALALLSRSTRVTVGSQLAKGLSAADRAALPRGVRPEVGVLLSDAERAAVEALSQSPALKAAFEKVGPRLEREELQALLTAAKASPGELKGMLTLLGSLEQEALSHALSSQGVARLASLAEKVGQREAPALAKLLARFDGQALETFLRVAEKVEAQELAPLLRTANKLDSKLVGEALKAFARLGEKLGLELSPKVAKLALSTLGKVAPVLGGLLSGAETVRLTKVALDDGLPKDLRGFAALGASLNGLDTALSVVELTGVGNADVPVQVALAFAEAGVALFLDAEVEKFKKDPQGYQPPPLLHQLVAHFALVAPAALVPIYGADVQRLAGDAVVGDAAAALRLQGASTSQSLRAGGAAAALTGDALQFAADVVRNPEAHTQEAVRDALLLFQRAAKAGGAVAQRAAREMAQAAKAIAATTPRAVEVLEALARNPAGPAALVVEKLAALTVSVAQTATDLEAATTRRAFAALHALGAGVVSAAQTVDGWKGQATGVSLEVAAAALAATRRGVEAAAKLGPGGLGLLLSLATDPTQYGPLAARALAEKLRPGTEEALSTLAYMAQHPGEVLDATSRAQWAVAEKVLRFFEEEADKGAAWRQQSAATLASAAQDAGEAIGSSAGEFLSGARSLLAGLDQLEGAARARALQALVEVVKADLTPLAPLLPLLRARLTPEELQAVLDALREG